MKKILYTLFFTLCFLMAVSFVRIITLQTGINDCMVEYVMSNNTTGYMYKIDNNRYHIDTKHLGNLEEIGVSKGCLMIPYQGQFSFMAISNTVYCSMVSLII